MNYSAIITAHRNTCPARCWKTQHLSLLIWENAMQLNGTKRYILFIPAIAVQMLENETDSYAPGHFFSIPPHKSGTKRYKMIQNMSLPYRVPNIVGGGGIGGKTKQNTHPTEHRMLNPLHPVILKILLKNRTFRNFSEQFPGWVSASSLFTKNYSRPAF